MLLCCFVFALLWYWNEMECFVVWVHSSSTCAFVRYCWCLDNVSALRIETLCCVDFVLSSNVLLSSTVYLS